MAKSKAFSQEQLQGPPPEQPSLLKKAGRGAISGMSAVANVLDLPGSMVRDAVAGKNPIDQLLTPFRDTNRTTGRDLARQYGLAGRKDTWANWGGGLAAEIALDPLTYFTFGGSALGKAGSAMKAAGITGQRAANMAARAAGKKLGQVGASEARHILTPRAIELLDPEAFAAMGRYAKKQGFDLGTMMDEKMGGVAKFWPTGTVLGQGGKAQSFARGMDQAFNAARFAKIPGTKIQPVGDLFNLVNAKAMGARTPGQLARSYELFDKREAARATGLKMEARGALDLKRNNLEAAANHERRLWMELESTAPVEYKPFVKELHKHFDAQLPRARNVGLRVGDANEAARLAGSQAKRVPRHLTKGVADERFGAAGKEFNAFGPEQMKRWEWSHGATRGTDTLRRMGNLVQQEFESGALQGMNKDDQIQHLAGVLASNFQGELPDQFLTAKARHLLKEYGKGVTPTVAAANSLLAAANNGKKVAKEVIKEITPRDSWEQAAKDLLKLSPELRKSGIFGNDPLQEAAKGFIGAEQRIANAQHVLDHLSEVGFVAPGKDTVQLRTLLRGVRGTANKGLGIHAGNKTWGAVQYLLKKQGIDLKTAKTTIRKGKRKGQQRLLNKKEAKKLISKVMNRHVDAETAKYLSQFKEGWDTPEQVGELLKLYDNIHRTISATFTSLRPSFAPRNLVSGQGANAFADQFTAQSLKDTLELAQGRAIKDAVKRFPVVQEEAAKRGIQNLDDEMATDLLRELMYAHELSSSYGAHQPHLVQASGGSSIQDVFQSIPGQHPFSPIQIAKRAVGASGDTTLNPMKGKWQGIDFTGKSPAEKSTFGPLAAGEDVNAFAELMNRGAPFLALLEQGIDPAQAAKQVFEAQVAYQPRFYTKTEQQVMSRLFQFFRYTKGQIPFVLRLLTEKPGGKLAQVLRGINSFRGEDELTPDYIQETTSIPLQTQEDGTQRYLTGLGLNFEDPLQFAQPSAQGLGMELMSRTALPIKGTIEGITGTSFFQRAPHGGGRLLEDMDPALGRLMANIGQMTGLRSEENKAPVRYPGSASIEHLLSNSPLSMPINMGRTLTDPRKGPLTKASQTLTGVRVQDISPATQDRVLRDRISLIEKRLGARTFTDTYIPKDTQAKLSPKEQELAKMLGELRKLLDARSKERRTKE